MDTIPESALERMILTDYILSMVGNKKHTEKKSESMGPSFPLIDEQLGIDRNGHYVKIWKRIE